LPQQVARLSWTHALAALVSLSAQFVLGPWKWRIALRMHHLHYPLSYLVRAYGVGFFFNTFLPSGIGGDAYRAASTWPKDGRTSRAISAVLVDRCAGFAVLVAIGCIAALPLALHNRYARIFVLAAISTAVGGVLVFRALRSGRMRRLGERLRGNRFFAAVIANFSHLTQARREWLQLIAVAVLFQAFGIAAIYLLFAGVDSPAPFATCILVGAASGVAVVVPVSINGIGVVEAAFVGAAVALGEPYGASLAVAVLMRVLVLPQIVVFGLVYALRGQRARPSIDHTAADASVSR
jgi:glycosyltransferase 2 family protein